MGLSRLIHFSVILVGGEKIGSNVNRHDGIKMFFDNIIRDGWLIIEGNRHRLISPKQIKEIHWTE